MAHFDIPILELNQIWQNSTPYSRVTDVPFLLKMDQDVIGNRLGKECCTRYGYVNKI